MLDDHDLLTDLRGEKFDMAIIELFDFSGLGSFQFSREIHNFSQHYFMPLASLTLLELIRQEYLSLLLCILEIQLFQVTYQVDDEIC